MTADPAIVWFRDDLRIADNPALNYAVQSGRPIIAIYIYPDSASVTRDYGSAQKWFLHHALLNLQKSLNQIGGRLDIFRGNPETIISDLISLTGCKLVTWNRRVGAKEIEIDTAVKTSLKQLGVEVKSFQGNLLHEPFNIKTGSGGPYRVYTPFWRSLSSKGEPRKPLPSPHAITKHAAIQTNISLADLELLPSDPNWAEGWQQIWEPSEKGAFATLRTFLGEGINGYNGGRDIPSQKNVSRLSPYLRFGILSPYQIWFAARMAEGSNSLESERCIEISERDRLA